MYGSKRSICSMQNKSKLAKKPLKIYDAKTYGR